MAAGGCRAGEPQQQPTLPDQPSSATPTLTRTVVLSSLSNPWDIAFGTDGTMFFTERCRGLSVRHTDGSVTRLFCTAGSSLVAADLLCQGQSGVHGIALDPSFATNRAVYVYMTSSATTPAGSNPNATAATARSRASACARSRRSTAAPSS